MFSLLGVLSRITSHRFFLPVILCALTLTCYAQVFTSNFIEAYDDEVYVTLNSAITGGFTPQAIRWSLTTFTGGNWNPVTWWSHLLDIQLFGLNPAGHHTTSILIHTINSVLIYALFLRLTDKRGRSFVIAAIFSLHPLHVESVAWVAERKDVLSSLFGVGSLHAYVSFVRSQRFMDYLALFFLFCLSLMAKPMLVTLPFLLLVLDFWPLKRMHVTPSKQLVLEKVPLLFPAVAISIVTVIAQNSRGALVPLSGNPVSTRISVALDAYMVYLRKFFAPFDLALFYPYAAPSGIRTMLAAALLCTISAATWRLRRNHPWLLTGWLWFLGMLVPVIGIVRVGLQQYADRYTYLPLVGVTIIAVWTAGEFCKRIERRGRIAVTASIVIVFSCYIFSWIQSGYWKDGFALYNRAISVTGRNWLAHNNLGVMLAKRSQYREAITHYILALADNPVSAETHYNLGHAFSRIGEFQSARKEFQSALQIRRNFEKDYIELARAFRGDGKLFEALQVIREGKRFIPSSPALDANETLILEMMERLNKKAPSTGGNTLLLGNPSGT